MIHHRRPSMRVTSFILAVLGLTIVIVGAVAVTSEARAVLAWPTYERTKTIAYSPSEGGGVSVGDAFTVTISFVNEWTQSTPVTVFDQNPAPWYLQILSDTLTGGANYVPGTSPANPEAVEWLGTLASNSPVTITFQMRVTDGAGQKVINWAWLDYEGTKETQPDAGDTAAIYIKPDPPSLASIDNPDGDGEYTVQWSGVPVATSYTLEEDDNPGFSSPIIRYTGPAVQHGVSGQAAGRWYYRVRASKEWAANESVSSVWSNVESVDILPLTRVFLPLAFRRWPPVPEEPVLLPIVNPNGLGSFTVSWNAAPRAESYILEQAKNSTFTGATVINVGASTKYDVSGLGAARYYYRVKARNGWGDSGWSNVQSLDVLWELEPNNIRDQANGPIISNLTYFGYGTVLNPLDLSDYFYFNLASAGTVELWLTNIPDGHNYDLVLRDANQGYVGYSAELGNADEYILSGLLPAGPYYVQVWHPGAIETTQPYHLRVSY